MGHNQEKAIMGVSTKAAETLVKFTKDGKESEEKVPYSAKQADDLEGAMTLADEAIAKVGDKEGEVEVTEKNRQDLMVAWILSRFNQVMEANARQNARAAFLTSIAGPDKAIEAMAKKLASLKKISVEDAEKQVRAAFSL